MTWAMKHAPIQKNKSAVRNRMVLTYLADRYNDDTKACWPSLDLIAKELDTSKTTIQRSIKDLEQQGLISRTSSQVVSYIPDYRRPTVWTLNLHLRRDVEGSNVGTGYSADKEGSNVDHPGVPTLTMGGSNVDHLTQSEPKPEPKENLIDHSGNDRFDEFWSVVPKKVGKRAAERAWEKAIKNTSPDVIIEGMKRYRDDPNRSDAFTKNPQGWLNDGRWMDDPLPARGEERAPRRSNTMEAWLGIPEGTLDQQEAFGGFDALRDNTIDGQVIDQKELGR